MTHLLGYTHDGKTIVAAPSRRAAAMLLNAPYEHVTERCDESGLEIALEHPGAIVGAYEAGWRVITPAPALPRARLSPAQERTLSWLAKGWHAQRSGGSYTVNSTTLCKLETLTSLGRLGLTFQDGEVYRATALGELFYYHSNA